MNTVTATLSAAPGADLREKLRGYWQRRTTMMVTAAIVLTVFGLLAVLLPPTYRSSATILIEQQEIPQDLVRSAISSFADQRIQVISQRVMTTQNLITLINRYDLYPSVRATKPREVLIQRMRDDIAMKMISADVIDPRSGHPTQATIAFSVGYQSESPDLALKVANELTTLYLNENLTSRTHLAEETTHFFAEQAASQQAHIDELDKKLAQFKEKHRDVLPELETLNQQRSDRIDQQLRDVENRIASMDEQRVLLEAQLAQISPTALVFSDTGQRVMNTEDRLRDLKSKLAGYKARYAPDHPDVVTTQREVDGLEKEVKSEKAAGDLARQLEEAKGQLAVALEKYSPDHPDVIHLRHVVADLEKSLTAQPDAANARKAQSDADNPAYIQVKGQLDALATERKSDEAKLDQLQAQLDKIDRGLAQEPGVEGDYRELVRELENAQLKYQQIRAKESDVQVSENLETERKGERFTMIEPPLPPEKPISPNRVLILALGLVLSVGAGFGAGAFRDSVDPSVRSANDLRRLLQAAPLASIPTIVTAAEERRRRWVTRSSWAGALMVLVAGAAAVHTFVRPLDIVWASLLHRFGM
jgi:succinoglycan biosynthesis transport protein ExoP